MKPIVLFLLVIVVVFVGLVCAEGEPCKPGDVKKEDCNTCHCTNGVFSCTKKKCVHPRVRRQECKPGDRRYDGCNTCTCMGGYWACTLLSCTGDNSRRPL